jgi:catechol 2,3-dioxygenase-like lactoylglutathione lyase family enzyme
MLHFYRDQLGFDVNDIDPGPPAVPLTNWVSLSTGSAILELFDAATYADAEKLRSTNRESIELCFIVDDVEAERQQLRRVGVSCHPVVTEGWGRYAAFRDPEGNRLQLFEVFDLGKELPSRPAP